MSGPGRRLASGWRTLAGTGGAAAAGLGVLVLACVFLAVSAPRQSLGVRTRALQHALTAAGPLAGSVTGSVEYTGFAPGVSGPVEAATLAAARRDLAANLAQARLPLAPGGTDWSGLTTGLMPVTGAAAPLYSSGTPPQMEILSRGELRRYVRLAAGRLPARARPAGHGAVLEIAVTSATAARFGLRPGTRIGTAAGITLAVTGIVAPRAPHSTFWTADPVAAAPRMTATSAIAPPFWTGAAFIGSAELPLLEASVDPAAMSLTWNFPLTLGAVTADQARTLAARFAQAEAQAGLLGRPGATLGGPAPITVSSGASGTLALFLQQDAAAGQVLSLVSVSLAVIAAAVVLLGARLLAERRRGEFGVLQARGASRGQLALAALRPAAAVTVLAAAAGSALAVALSPGDAAPLGWWLAALTVAAVLAGLPLFTIRAHRAAAPPSGPPSGPGRPAAGQRAAWRLMAEAALIAAAVGTLIALRQQAAPGAGGGSAFVSLAPVLVALLAVILVMRCDPVALRGLVRLSRIRPGATALIGFARAADSIQGAVLPVFALVLALAVVALGTMIRGAVLRAEVAASWQRTGADAVIDASAAARPLTPAVQAAIAAVAGVQHTAAVIVTSGSAGGTALTVAAVRPAQYQALIAAAPGGVFPAAPLGGPPAGAGRTGPALASPAAAALLRGQHPAVVIGTRRIPVRVAGPAAGLPGVLAGAFVVLSQQALGARPPLPSLMLVAGPHLDQRRLAALTRRALPGAAVTFRSAALTSLTTAPLPRSAGLAIAAGAAAAAILSVLVVLMTALLGARSREAVLARLRVLGLGPAQARGLAVAEALPQVLAAVAGGLTAAWALAPLLGPSIDLSAFTGSAARVPIRPEVPLLAAAAAGLVLVALASTTAQTFIAGRRPARGTRSGARPAAPAGSTPAEKGRQS
jgi:putative ABC transport system permease protein